MLHAEQIEELVALVSSLDRDALIHQFQTFPAKFPVDFSDDFLHDQPLDRLRHIFLAMCLQQQRMPQLTTIPTPQAA